MSICSEFNMSRKLSTHIFTLSLLLIIIGFCKHTEGILFDTEFPKYSEVRNHIIQKGRITVKELIERHEFKYEEHEVITEDGYKLTMHRIPYGPDGPSGNRQPIVLVHGLESSSADWVVTGPENGIGFKLVVAGYDVWMCNSRGNAFSRKHVTLDPDNPADKEEFFDFSFHESGIFDLPAQINHVLQITNYDQVFCFGHSVGTTVIFIMLSTRTSYNSKVKAVFSAGTSIYMEHMTSPLRVPLTALYLQRDVLDLLQVYEVFSHDQFINGFDVWCAQNSPLFEICGALVNALGGDNGGNWNYTAQPEIFQNFPAGTSANTVYHCAQMSIPGSKLRPYCYTNILKNLHKYGEMNPSEYPLRKVTVPVFMHICSNDTVNTPAENEMVQSKRASHLKFQNTVQTLRRTCSEFQIKPQTNSEGDDPDADGAEECNNKLSEEDVSTEVRNKNDAICQHHRNRKSKHTTYRLYVCKGCYKDFTQLCDLKAHKCTHTGYRPFACNTCGKAYTRMAHLKDHERIHTGDRPFGCSICGKAFKRMAHLKNHKLIHTGDRPFGCNTCGKSFTQLTHLEGHKRIHTGEKPFGCSTCGKEFTHLASLWAHKHLHTSDRPFRCNICGKVFTTEANLRKHQRLHTSERPFGCSTCGKAFAYESGLKKHIVIHTGERPFGCNTCGKTFKRLADLKVHKCIHTGERPFGCSTCGKVFKNSSNLTAHEQLHIAN